VRVTLEKTLLVELLSASAMVQERWKKADAAACTLALLAWLAPDPCAGVDGMLAERFAEFLLYARSFLGPSDMETLRAVQAALLAHSTQ
jgi:hypothetical protein